MTIRPPGRDLFVVRSVRTSPDLDIYICRDDARRDERLYTLLVYKEPSRIYDAITIFMQIKRRAITPDFVDCFSLDSHFHALFLYHEENPLVQQHARRELMQRERLEAAHSILTQILMQDLPEGLLQDCLSDENLLFSTSLEVTFGYMLNNAQHYRLIERQGNMIRVADLLASLLGREARLEANGENIEPMIQRLREGYYPTWAAAYADFKIWYDVVRSFVESEEVRIESMVNRFWRVISRILGIAKPILAVLLVLLSIAYMVYTLLNPPIIKGAKRGEIAVIGDVVLPTPIPLEEDGDARVVPWELEQP